MFLRGLDLEEDTNNQWAVGRGQWQCAGGQETGDGGPAFADRLQRGTQEEERILTQRRRGAAETLPTANSPLPTGSWEALALANHGRWQMENCSVQIYRIKSRRMEGALRRKREQGIMA